MTDPSKECEACVEHRSWAEKHKGARFVDLWRDRDYRHHALLARKEAEIETSKIKIQECAVSLGEATTILDNIERLISKNLIEKTEEKEV